MKRMLFAMMACAAMAGAQTSPAITKWLINTSGVTGHYYLTGNVTPQTDATKANVQEVSYSSNYVYVKATGIPSYTIGPYALGTVTQANDNAYVFKLPLHPAKATTATTVGMGATAVFINGTVAYSARDAATYNNLGKWHQNAVYFENAGFDCAHGHPGPMSSDYHAHQNPSAFKVSSVPTSNVCNVYMADGLYVPDASKHGPLIGFAPDGYPIYGAYGYTDATDATSAIKRLTPGYRLRSMTSRTTLPDGTAAAGPTFTEMITSMLPGSSPLVASLGAYEEDYEYVSGIGDLDEHNGRFCKTPEYPEGTYCYFATIDADNNPVYPYLVGTTYYGVVDAQTPTNSFTRSTISEPVTVYTPVAVPVVSAPTMNVSIFPNPTRNLLVVQCDMARSADRQVSLIDYTGKVVERGVIYQGSTMCYFNVETLYPGVYIVPLQDEGGAVTSRIEVSKW